MYKRFKWNPIIRYDDWVWHDGCNIPRGSKTFVGSTIELFGDWIEPEWMEIIFSYCRSCPSHIFIFLTKQPQNLRKFSPFPDNAWVGVTATNKRMTSNALFYLDAIEAKVKFISFEPLLEDACVDSDTFWTYTEAGIATGEKEQRINWVIIGGQSGKDKFYPPEEWIEEIESACGKARIPAFEKNNLRKVWNRTPRQEMP